jgi:hypothetical protein
MTTRSALAVGTVVLVVGLAAAGCGGGSSSSSGASSTSGSASPSGTKSVNPSAPEQNPAGDIPDNQAYVAYRPPGSTYAVKVPEGWSRTTSGGAVSFTDKLNTVRLEQTSAQAAPTVAGVKRTILPKLARTQAGYRAGSVTVVRRTAGPAVRITYFARSKPDPVTGKARVDAVERYLFFRHGQEAVVTLSGPKGADNVDPWRIITDSLRWTR